MKLTGKLKDKVDAVKTAEEKKDIIAQAGMELTDEELEGVAGGGTAHRFSVYCPTCKEHLGRRLSNEEAKGLQLQHIRKTRHLTILS